MAKFNINTFQRENRGERLVKNIICVDGFTMSAQASSYHYCFPKEDGLKVYETYEVGHPNKKERLLSKYRVDPGIYAFVPAEIINKIVDKHGGLDVTNYPKEGA